MAAVVHQPPSVQFQAVSLPSSGHVPTQDPNIRRQKYANALYGLGITELIIGIIMVILGIIGLSLSLGGRSYGFSIIAPGIWCSAPLIASGAVGMCAKWKSSTCLYNANMVLSIISAVMMGVLFIFSVILALSWHSIVAILVVIQYLLAIGSFSAMVINIIHSACCCAGVCCQRNYYPGQVVYIPAPQPNQQYVQLANGQYMMVQAAPSPAGCPLQNVSASPLHAPYHPTTYVHPPTAQGPRKIVTAPVFQRSNENEYHAVAQQEQVSMDPPGSLLPKFPVTFDE